jgi:hypothetical protein
VVQHHPEHRRGTEQIQVPVAHGHDRYRKATLDRKPA